MASPTKRTTAHQILLSAYITAEVPVQQLWGPQPAHSERQEAATASVRHDQMTT